MKSLQTEFVFPKRIGSIQCLRFFAAVAVAFSHFGIVHDATDSAFNVTFFLRWFFTISGFIVMLSTEKVEKRKGFLCRRFIRLTPLYWLLTIMVFAAAQFMPALIGYKPDVWQLLKSMFFIPFSRGGLKSDATLRPIVGLGHTLQMEIFFSVIFAISMKISHKHRGAVSGVILLILALVGIFLPFENDFCHFYLNKNYLSLISFAVGILCYYFMVWMQSAKVKSGYLAIGGAGLALVALVQTQLVHELLASSKLAVTFGFVAYFAIILCAVAYSAMDLPAPRLIQALGDASFSYYLIHYFIVSLAERFLHIDSFSPRNIVLMVLVVAGAWVIAYISYYIIEKRFGGWLVKQANRMLKC